jgi:hypothetical protein
MATRVELTFEALHREGLQAIYDQFDDGQPTYYTDITPVEINDKQAYFRFIQEGDFGLATAVDPANPIPTDDIFHGYQTDVRAVKRGKGFDIDTMAEHSDMYNRFAAIIPKLKWAFRQTMETHVADIINNATATGDYANPDGLALASTAHLYDGGTLSNLITDAFGPLAVEKMIQNQKLTKSHRGLPDPHMGPFRILIHPSQEMYAERVVFSAGQQGTANNDKNRLGKRIQSISGNPYLTNTIAWTVIDVNKDRQPLALLKKRGIRIRNEEDIDLDVMKYRVTEAYKAFARGWRGLQHSTGAGS